MNDGSALLSLRLAGGGPATLSLTPEATVVSVEDVRVSSYDLSGRPYALVRDGGTWRRALDGRLLQKGVGEDGGPRVRRLLSADEGTPVVEAARLEAEAVLAVLEDAREFDPHVRGEALRRLERIVAMDAPALREDASRFAATYHPVGILPPDQYLALVLQVTEGCSWSACTFCDFYRGLPFHAKTRAELERHMAAVRDYFGDALALRRTIFLGSANALCLSHERLLTLLEGVARAFPVAPLDLSPAHRRAWLRAEPGRVSGIYAFVDAWTGRRKGAAEWREYAQLGLRRVYVGLETGDPELLAWLGKPGSPEDAVELVSALHQAGIAAGVIVLVGAGGAGFAASHALLTSEALSRMRLDRDDLLYFSELVAPPGLDYARRAAEDGIHPLGREGCAFQRQAIASSFRPAHPARRPRTATYDIREFVY